MSHLSLLLIGLLAFNYTGFSSGFSEDDQTRIMGIVRQESSAATAANMNVPLGGCVVQLFFEKNGELDSLYTTTSHKDGRFYFRNIPVQRVFLKFRCLGYETQSGVYDLGAGDNAFLITMKEKAEELQEAKVFAEIPLMTRLKDTTIFNTRAIKSMSGDGLKEVLEQIPGFSVSDAGIFVNGLKVSRTYVNGLLVFGDEALNAVNALRADEVTQVKVYDEQSAIDRHRGRKNSRKERVLDVITKERFLSLAQLGIAASGGLDCTPQGRYAAAAAAAYDSQMLNASAYILADNIGSDQDYSYSPSSIDSYVGLGERGPLKQYTQREQADVFLSRHWKNRNFGNSMRGHYTFDHLYTSSASKALTDYFRTETSQAMTQMDSSSSTSSILMHNLGLSLDLLDTPLKSFNISLGGSYAETVINNEDISSKKIGEKRTYGRHESSYNKNLPWSLSSRVQWTNNDVVKWRPEVNVEANFNRNTLLSWTIDTLETSFLKRQLSSNGFGNNIAIDSKAGISVNLVNTKAQTFDLSLFATANYIRNRSRKMTLDEWDVPEPVKDLANSYDYTRDDLTTAVVAEFDYSSAKDLSIRGSVSINDRMLLNDEFFPVDFSRRKNFVYPEYNVDVKIRNWDIESSLKELSPSIEQISNRVCDTNPLILTGGNPNLGQSFQVNASMLYRPEIKSHKGGIVSSLTLRPSASITANPIVRRVIHFDKDTILEEWDGYKAQSGSVLYTYSNNSRPSWNIGATGEYAVSLRYSIYNLRLTLSSNYSQSSQFSGNDQVWIGDWVSRMNVAFMYNPSRRLRIIEKPGFAYIQSNDNKGVNLSSRLVFTNSLNASWDIVLNRLKFECRYDFNGYDYISGLGRNHFSHTLNAELKLRLLEDYSLNLSLQALDLLNSGSIYTSSVNASYMMQTWNPTYGRYFMLNISYVFRKKG